MTKKIKKKLEQGQVLWISLAVVVLLAILFSVLKKKDKTPEAPPEKPVPVEVQAE